MAASVGDQEGLAGSAAEAARKEAGALGEVVSAAAVAYGRADLAGRVPEVVDRLDNGVVRLPIVGEFKQGKSSFVNALLGIDLCQVDDDEATAVPSAFRWGPEVTRRADDDAFELTVDRALLRQGLVVVDTPGVGGLASRHASATRAALVTADAVVVVSSAAQELTAAELSFVTAACDRCDDVVIVLTKTDLSAAWRRIADLNRGHLARAGLPVPVLAVSCVTRWRALDDGDADVNAESGFPDVVAWLREQVLDRTASLARRRVASGLADIVQQLRGPLAAEADALRTGDPGAVAALEAARSRREDLRSSGARWQVALADGVTELAAELDHDLRRRSRQLLRDCESVIDDHDPADDWATLQPQFERSAADEIGAVFEGLYDRFAALALNVATQFELAADVPPTASGVAPEVGGFGALGELTFERRHAARQLLTGMRGTYSGMLMFGTLGQLAGLVLSAPATIALGLVLGRSSLREERRRELATRRTQAKQALRAYVDEVVATAGKEARQAVRGGQRQLREQLEARAAELLASADAAMIAARTALEAGDGEARLADVDAELARLDALAVALDDFGRGDA